MDWCPKGVDIAASILSRSNNGFLVYFDPDVDGLFSGKEVCDFLDAFGKPYQRYINQNRAHGFFYEDIASLRGKTVIAVDFAITPDKLELLRQNRVLLINIDHHNIDSPSLVTYSFDGSDQIDGVVINNQYSFEPEEHRYLSGAGVVFYVLSHLVSGFDCEINRAIVGLTLLSDIRPLENENARVFLKTCYTCRHPYMKYLVDVTKAEKDFTFGVPRMERNYVDYTFSPKINALFRLNMGDVAMDLAFGKRPAFSLNDAREKQNEIRDYIIRGVKSPFRTNGLLQVGTPEVVIQNFVRATDAGMTVPDYSLELKNLSVKYIAPALYEDKYTLSNFIGLACSNIKGFGTSCLTYVGDDDAVERGSFRGRFDSVDYLGVFRKYGFAGRCDGHKVAFGVLPSNLSEIDFAGLSSEIGALEAEAAKHEYENRVVDVDNMSVFIHSSMLKEIALSNIYVRDSHRMYIRYTGTNVVRNQRGNMYEFNIDGIVVKCFNDDITTANGYILPIYDRGQLAFYLKNIKK